MKLLPKKNSRTILLLLLLLLILLFRDRLSYAVKTVTARDWDRRNALPADRTVKMVIDFIAPSLRPKMKKLFLKKGCEYPPKRLTFIAIKNDKILEVWGTNNKKKPSLITTYSIIGASGSMGPKLKQGDYQVPEGFYSITWLNPFSAGYLSMKLDYPNEFDQKMAKKDKRTNLGGDIFIHGDWFSTGCLAMGDIVMEELFLLAYDAGMKNVKVIIMPYDFRSSEISNTVDNDLPKWAPELYKTIKEEVKKYVKGA